MINRACSPLVILCHPKYLQNKSHKFTCFEILYPPGFSGGGEKIPILEDCIQRISSKTSTLKTQKRLFLLKPFWFYSQYGNKGYLESSYVGLYSSCSQFGVPIFHPSNAQFYNQQFFFSQMKMLVLLAC